MIKLYKDEKKNDKIKEVVADLRKTQMPFSFKYYLLDEKIYWIMKKYKLTSREIARKITWILTGDCKRQHEICKTLGKEYTIYDNKYWEDHNEGM